MAEEATTENTDTGAGDAAAEGQQQGAQAAADAAASGQESNAAAGEPGGEGTPGEDSTLLGAEESGGDATGEDGDDNAAGDAATTVPETYADFELPDGVEMDKGFLDAMSPVFKELGLTQEKAQTLISAYAQQVQAGEAHRKEAFNQLVNGWRTEVKNDKEIGGERFEESISDARSALSQLGTPELNQLFRDYGIGSHPEIVRAFSKMGKLLKEDRPGGAAPTQEPKSRVDILYGDPTH